MPNPNIRFVAADMDGTLLDPNGQLDPRFFSLFEQLDNKDVIFAAASGRQYHSLMETFAPINQRMMFVAENGTLVMHQGKELYSNTIDRKDIHAIITAARAIDGAHIVLCGKACAYIESVDEQAHQEIKKYYASRKLVDDLLQVEDEFIKVAILHFDGTEQRVAPSFSQQFGESHQVVVSAKIWLDVMNKTASKGAAIEHLQKTIGFSKQQTLSFGDFFNDVEMLKASGHAYVMENAHPEMKQYATAIAPSHAQAGVLTTIADLFGLELSDKA